MSASSVQYSFVFPIYNEEETLEELRKRMFDLLQKLDGKAEVILVDDGSRDRSLNILINFSVKDPRFKVIHLSRNFGHQIAITAGMDLALGAAVIVMDADLQDPPEVVLQMIEKWKEGYEIVYARRKKREGESWFKKLTASFYYRMLRRLSQVDIPTDVGDFRLVDRKALDAFKLLRENHRFIRGMFSWVGFSQTCVEYIRPERFAGQTKYPLRKMIQLAMDGIVSFSNAPLRLALQLGLVVSLFSFVAGVTAITLKVGGWYTVTGWTSLTVIISFIGGVQLMVMGMMGEYIARIHEEVKNRPLYFVKSLYGFDSTLKPEPRTFVPQTKI